MRWHAGNAVLWREAGWMGAPWKIEGGEGRVGSPQFCAEWRHTSSILDHTKMILRDFLSGLGATVCSELSTFPACSESLKSLEPTGSSRCVSRAQCMRSSRYSPLVVRNTSLSRPSRHLRRLRSADP